MVIVVVMMAMASVEVVALPSPKNTPDPTNDVGREECLQPSEEESAAVATLAVTAGCNKSSEAWQTNVENKNPQSCAFVGVDHASSTAAIVMSLALLVSWLGDNYSCWLGMGVHNLRHMRSIIWRRHGHRISNWWALVILLLWVWLERLVVHI